MAGQYKNLKKQMDDMFGDLSKKKFAGEDNAETLKAIGKDIIDSVSPVLAEHNKQFQESTQEIIRSVLKEIKVELPKIDSPQFDNDGLKSTILSSIKEAFGGLRFPEPKVNVRVPDVNIPEIKLPTDPGVKEMRDWMKRMNYDVNNPMPVQLRDKDGKVVNLLEMMSRMSGGGSGGGRALQQWIEIRGLNDSTGASVINPDGRLRVETLDSSGGATEVRQVSGSIDSVNVQQVGGNTVVVGTGYQDNALRVVHATDATVSVKLTEQSVTLDIKQVSGSIDSVNVAQQDITLDVRQVSGSIDSVKITSTDAALDIKQVSGSVDSVYIQDAISLPVYQLSGSVDSSQIKLIARQTNPSAASDGASAFASSDDLGRVLTRPIQVRDLTQTAYATFSTGTEATLISGVASTFLDLIYIMGANNSDAAVSVDIRSGTGGSVIMTLQIPANGTAGVALPVPLPQEIVAGAWTVDLPDITGTTVSVSALFTKEV